MGVSNWVVLLIVGIIAFIVCWAAVLVLLDRIAQNQMSDLYDSDYFEDTK